MAAFNVSLPNVLAELDETFPQNIQQGDYTAEATALQAQLSRQTARFMPIEGGGRNKKLLSTVVYWQKQCDIEVTDCSDECVVSTNEVTDDSETYTLDGCKQVDFKESWKRYRTAPHQLESSIAQTLGRNLNKMDEYLSGQFILFLEASKGTHEYAAMPYGSNNAGDWEIAANDWTDNLVPHLRLSARFARFPQFYLLDGLNLLTTVEKARYYGANDNGRGENSLWQSLNYVFDPIKMVELAADKTYLVNPGSVALLTGNWWDSVPVTHAGDHRMFTVASRNLPGVSYDVHEIQACSSNDFVTSWQIRANYKFVLNPEGCTADRTGVLSFKKIAGI